MAFSSDAAKAFITAGLGRGMPGGGMRPTRSLRIIFSARSALLGDMREVELGERHAAGFGLVVMAVGAILIEKGALRGFGGKSGRGGRRRVRGRFLLSECKRGGEIQRCPAINAFFIQLSDVERRGRGK